MVIGMDNQDYRPSPEMLLEKIKDEEYSESGKLKIFFGYAAGVGKTYAMLDEAKERFQLGEDVLVGYVEPHERPETLRFLEGLPVLSPRTISYKGIELKEFDLDEALRRKPGLILVDELAHTNAGGSRNRKRYQDVEELLNAGIDVYTTVNVQHLESLNNVVEDVTKVSVRETVPDYLFDRADMVKVIDIEPEELLHRLKEGKVYREERAKTALNNFFTIENLRVLREIALRKATERISNENQNEWMMQEKAASTKFLVCIGASPSSAKCLRWTARAAEAFHSHWTAVYVEEEESCKEQKQGLRENVELAEKLGAEVNTLIGHDIAQTIAEYARLSGITNIVVGKSRNKKTIRSLFEMDFEDRLISLLPNVEIHIIPDSAIKKRFKAKSSKSFLKPSIIVKKIDMFKMTGILLSALLLCEGLQKFNFGEQNVIMVFILSVLIISRTTEGYFYGVLASVVSVLLFNFFFTEPYFTFNAIGNGYPLTFSIMLLVALITSALTVRIKTQARLAVEREHRTEVMYEINKKLLATRGRENIVALVLDYAVKLFDRSVILYTINENAEMTGSFLQSKEEEDASFLNSEDEKAVAHWVFLNKKRAGAGTDTLMGAGAFYQPILIQGNALAVIGLSCKGGILDHNNRLFLRMISPLVAMALERQRLSDEQRNILVETEKEKMRSNLLRAISHDLRTPLTGILGASSAILENEGTLNPKVNHQLVVNIKEDSQWLIRMVENLLSVTRIKEGSMNVTKTLEAGEEVIAEAVSRIRIRYPGRNILVKVPDELLEIPMDGTLIAQVIINLLENAIKHSNEEELIEIHLRKQQELALFEVLDNGRGIPKEDIPYLFESFIPGSEKPLDSSRGLGIGLSICMSIIKAHNGRMEAENRSEGGAAFRFYLPLEEGIQS